MEDRIARAETVNKTVVAEVVNKARIVRMETTHEERIVRTEAIM